VVDYAHYVQLLYFTQLDANKTFAVYYTPYLQGYVRAMQHGWPFPTIRMAGMLEDRLATALGQISADVIAHPDSDLDALISSRLEPLARRLETALNTSG
jgi:hypothetical protein